MFKKLGCGTLLYKQFASANHKGLHRRQCLPLGSMVMKVRLWLGKGMSHSPSLYHPKARTLPFHASMFICRAWRCAGSQGLDQGSQWGAGDSRQNPVFMCGFASFFSFLQREIHSCHQFFKGTVTLRDCSAPRLPSYFALYSFLSRPDKQLRKRQPLTGRVLARCGGGKRSVLPVGLCQAPTSCQATL